MNQIKRRSSVDESSKEQIKRLKGIFDEKKTINCLENFPNEIFYEIFEYLEGCELYNAFSNLNTRFQHVLACSSIRLKIDLSYHSETILQYQSDHIITPNKHQIISLKLSKNFWYIDSDLTRFTIDSAFSRLESLILVSIESKELIPILISLMSLSRLSSLTLNCYNDLDEIGSVYQIIFNLPILRYNKLSFFIYEPYIPLSIATSEQFTGIEFLVIDHSCTLNELVTILSYTPQLRRLTCEQITESNKNIIKEALHTISSLTDISIARCYAEFDELKFFITRVSPQLQVLRVISTNDVAYLDADQWERIISQHLLHLRVFELKYEESIDDDMEVTLYHERIHLFNSSFWIKRKWFLRLYIDTNFLMQNILVYSVSSCSKKNDERYINGIDQSVIVNEHESVACSIVPPKTNILTVIDVSYMDDEELLNDTVRSILLMTQITCLNIMLSEIFIGTLIDLIRCLPNLDSLVVSSLAMLEPRCLSVEETRTLRLISNNNKITKFKLHRTSDLAEIQFLLGLCCRVEYLEVDCANGVSPERFVRFILMKNIKYIPNLSSLCFEISQTEEDIVDKLKQMIDFEQLCHNYASKQIKNRIYLRWNL